MIKLDFNLLINLKIIFLIRYGSIENGECTDFVMNLRTFLLLRAVDCCGSNPCQNGGTCENNACTCATGFSGVLCSTGVSIATYAKFNRDSSFSLNNILV